jgi:lipopolysaccharide heptosyltransferase I
LIIKLSSIGDVVHTLPALATLKRSFPDAEIDWLVEKKARIVLEGNAFIHEVIVADTHRWRESWWTPRILKELKGLLRRLRSRKYDVAIDFQGLWKSAALGYFSNSRLFLGFDAKALKEPGCRVFYKKRISPSLKSHHVVEKYLDLVRSLGDVIPTYNFDLNPSEEDEQYVSQQLNSHGIKSFVILNPGGGWITKNWLPENYAELHDKLYGAYGLESVVTWGPGEEALVERMVNSCKTKPPAKFPTTLSQFIVLARKAKLFVGGDTGPLHIAAASGTPVVGIYGPTDPARNGPFGQEAWVAWEKVPCGPCYLRTCKIYHNDCLRKIDVDRVFNLITGRMKMNVHRGLY